MEGWKACANVYTTHGWGCLQSKPEIKALWLHLHWCQATCEHSETLLPKDMQLALCQDGVSSTVVLIHRITLSPGGKLRRASKLKETAEAVISLQ